MAAATSQEKSYLSCFHARESNGTWPSPTWLSTLRKNAIDAFERQGFPTARRGNEPWKYTDVRSLASATFAEPTAPGLLNGSTGGVDLSWYDLPCPRVHQVVFVDGHYAADLSTEPPEEAGIRSDTIGKRRAGLIVGRLTEGIQNGIPQVQEHLALHANVESNAFTALNTAFIDDGALVYIPDGVFVPEPIYLLYITTGRSGAAVTYPRSLIIAGRDSRATVLQSYESLGASPNDPTYFTNAVSEVVTGPGATLRLYRLQREGTASYHVATTHATVGRDSSLSSVTIDLGGGLVRHDQAITLADSGASVSLDGLYVAGGNQHVDNHTLVDHAVGDTTSGEVYKGILKDKAHGVFVGQVLVRKDSQHADARQVNKNLLLSDEAEIDTQPKLEIFADDVKCTHGAAVGQLDQRSLFYLRSRGLEEQTARELLVHGFVGEVIDTIEDDAIRQYSDEAVAAVLG
jgi:Fe-S cluster assembly protein SufD